jgi:hypothetical protein
MVSQSHENTLRNPLNDKSKESISIKFNAKHTFQERHAQEGTVPISNIRKRGATKAEDPLISFHLKLKVDCFVNIKPSDYNSDRVQRLLF